MTNNKAVLCGGTFFMLLLESRKQRTSKRDNANGKTDGLSQVDMFIELIKIVHPMFKAPAKATTLDKNVLNYKKCIDNGGSYFEVIFTTNYANSFDNRIKTNYHDVEFQFKTFTDTFIEPDAAEWLVRALLEIIDNDVNISPFITLNLGGHVIDKSSLISINKIELHSFLLAIWHYIIMNVTDNSIGKDTFALWNEKSGDKNSQWRFKQSIKQCLGASIRQPIKIDIDAETNCSEDVCSDNEDGEYAENHFEQEKTTDTTSTVTNQIIINGNINNMQGNNNKQYNERIGILIEFD